MGYPIFQFFGTTVKITQFFGERPEVYARFKMLGHNGVDMHFYDLVNRSLDNGVINGIYFDPKGYGHYIRVTTDDGFESTYGHFDSITHLSVGQRISIGQKLDPEGMSGFASGKHLHYGRKPLIGRNQANGYLGSVDPWSYLEQVLTNSTNKLTMDEEVKRAFAELNAKLDNQDQRITDTQNHIQKIENMMTNSNGDNRLKVTGNTVQELKDKLIK